MKSLRPRTHIFTAAALLLLAFGGAGAFAQTRPKPQPRPPGVRDPLVVLAPAPDPSRWGEFKSQAGGFKVKLPGTPAVKEAPFQKGPMTFARTMHHAVAGDMRIELEYFDAPPGYITPDLSLEGGVSGIVNALAAEGARLLARGAFKHRGCDGREATLALPAPAGLKPGFAWGRVYVSGDRVFALLFSGFEDTPRTREASRVFMESFEIEGGCRATAAPATAAPPPVKRRVEGVADAATGWRRIEDEALGFGALLPGGADYEAEQTQAAPFVLTHHAFAHEGESDFYSVEVISEYPAGFHDRPESLRTMIDVSFYAAQKNLEPLGFVVAPLRELKADGRPGREFSLASEKLGARGRMQMFATPKRVYIFTAFTHSGSQAVAGVECFFASIKIAQK